VTRGIGQINPSRYLISPVSKTIAVLGAGATGLTAAYRLSRLGHRVRVFERSERVGGSVRTDRVDGWLIESGPNSLQGGNAALTGLIRELGMESERVEASTLARHRYIVRDGRLRVAPLSPSAFLQSALFSPWAKLQIVSDLISRPRERTNDVSVGEFLRGHFGSEFVNYAVDPLVTGVYAGDPARLSARHAFPKMWALERKYGSLLRGQKASRSKGASDNASRSTFSLKAGLQTLTDALAAGIPQESFTLNASIDAILPGEKWSVVWHEGPVTHTERFDAVVVALPAPALGQLRIGALGERPLAAMDGVLHAPISTLFLGYRREQIRHPLNGFGVLVPSAEKRSTLGVLFSSSVFADRAPPEHVALTVMIGGTRRPELAALPTPALLRAVQGDLGELLGVTGEPKFVRHRFWPQAIPQYNVGYERFLAAMETAENTHRGLFIGGQARNGIALPTCLEAGEQLALRAAG
jgi:oxygen-dependent protoporphyrinogen oxidase